MTTKGRHITSDSQRGQALTEFAMIVPLLVTLVMGLFEFGFAIAANVGINRATQNAAHMASTAGNMLGADCLILDEVEKAVIVPNDRNDIIEVSIQRTDLTGDNVFATNRWTRTGSTTCTLASGEDLAVPYVNVADGYPNAQRCNVVIGCPSLTPARTTVDNIGVVVRYHHRWATPVGAALPTIGGDAEGWTFEQRNVFRMEPHL